MDRGKATTRNLSQRGRKVHLETPHIQIWSSLCHPHQEQYSIQSSGLRRDLDEARCQAPITSIKHPQTNGQMKAANRVILKALHTRLDKSKDLWKEELSSILRAYHYSPQTTINETPFWLTYSIDAMILIKVEEPLTRRLLFQEQKNEENIRFDNERCSFAIVSS